MDTAKQAFIEANKTAPTDKKTQDLNDTFIESEHLYESALSNKASKDIAAETANFTAWKAIAQIVP